MALSIASAPAFALGDDAALCLERAKKGDISVCEKYAEQNPGSVEAKRALARGYVELGEFGEVVDIYQAIADQTPDDAQALYDLSGALGFIRRYKEAAQVLERLIKLEPSRAETRMALAIMYRSLEQSEDAYRATAAAARLGDAVAMYHLFIYLRDGYGTRPDPHAAVAWAEKAAEAGHAKAMEKLIELYLKGGMGVEPDAAAVEKWAGRLHDLEASE